MRLDASQRSWSTSLWKANMLEGEECRSRKDLGYNDLWPVFHSILIPSSISLTPPGAGLTSTGMSDVACNFWDVDGWTQSGDWHESRSHTYGKEVFRECTVIDESSIDKEDQDRGPLGVLNPRWTDRRDRRFKVLQLRNEKDMVESQVAKWYFDFRILYMFKKMRIRSDISTLYPTVKKGQLNGLDICKIFEEILVAFIKMKNRTSWCKAKGRPEARSRQFALTLTILDGYLSTFLTPIFSFSSR